VRILFCNRGTPSRRFGASKVLIELAEELEAMGWRCAVRGASDIWSDKRATHHPFEEFPQQLREYLRKHAEEYDVVEYDHEDLPFSRSDFPSEVLMVARSVLLTHHFAKIEIPRPTTVKNFVRHLVFGKRDGQRMHERIQSSQRTIEQSDLVNVSNTDDKAELIRNGIPEEKIIVLPFGIGRERRPLFDAISINVPPGPPIVAFTGTFDFRKGAKEFPLIWQRIHKAIPIARLRLLGTNGLMRNEQEVRGCFSREANESIEVYPKFEPNELPALLAPCHVGIFPSHIEGFGLGALEMLAAGCPVIGYKVPGPSDILPHEYLVPAGDGAALACKVIETLTDANRLGIARRWARERSQQFQWSRIAEETAHAYKAAHEARPSLFQSIGTHAVVRAHSVLSDSVRVVESKSEVS
jgi:glycosyltransferase involved in cell wall biosynthesis